MASFSEWTVLELWNIPRLSNLCTPTAYVMLFLYTSWFWFLTLDSQNNRQRFTESLCFISFSGKSFVGANCIFATLSEIRKKLAGDRPHEKLVHVVEKIHCRPHEEDGVAIHVSGSFILGTHVIVCGSALQVEGLPFFGELTHDVASNHMGVFHEQFHMKPGSAIGIYTISKQELHILER